MQIILKDLFLYRSTCHVYILRHGSSAFLIDFGDGSVLDELPGLGIRSVTAVLLTHHHRDQGQGLPKAVEAGIPVWVPDMERELFSDVDWHWQGRNIMNNYNVCEDRFSLLHSIPITGVLKDYEKIDFGGFLVEIIPTPGHTPGSISISTAIDGIKVCFVGDLIAGEGKLWSLASTQWTYNGAEGVGYIVLSLLSLKKLDFQYLLPSHGKVMDQPSSAIDQLVTRLLDLLHARDTHLSLVARTENPFLEITPHVYRNLTCTANSYVVVSDSGKAMLIDYGYDFIGGFADGTGRATRRPWLYTIPVLKKRFGVSSVDVALPTHYHDDHVAGFNLLRRFEGTKIWGPENFADILRDPLSYNLPCLWFDPISVDVVQPLEKKIYWEEFSITLYALPGHTRYAVAILLEADEKRILFTGDQFQGDQGLIWNYVYQNRYDLLDYNKTAELYLSLHPDIILSGHWEALETSEEYFEKISASAERLSTLHKEILPLDDINPGVEGFIGRLYPYQKDAAAGSEVAYLCEVTNPMNAGLTAKVHLALPPGWQAIPEEQKAFIKPYQVLNLSFRVKIPASQPTVRRERIAADIVLGDITFGQQAEALVNVTHSG